MRITGGKYCGRTILYPKGVLRPAMDRMRTSLFAVLGSLEGQSFLDLFSGSGIVAVEAASRGASPIDLVEKDFLKKPTILKNLSFVEEEARLHMTSVEMFIKKATEQWDVIYSDPPFPMGQKLEVLELIQQKGLLKVGGTLMMHYPGEETYPETIGDLRQYDKRTYGRSHVILYTRD